MFGMYTGEDDLIFLTSLEGIHTCHLEVLERKEGAEREVWMNKARKRGREAGRERQGKKGGWDS